MKMKIKVKEITGDEINEYYAYLRARGLKGTSCQRLHSLLHLAFKSAMKRRIIPTNPVDQADRPKSVQFIGNYYNAEEIKHQAEMKKAFGRGYCKKYEDYICVDAVGELIRPNYVSDHFPIVLRKNGLRKIRFHDLRHSYAVIALGCVLGAAFVRKTWKMKKAA